MICNPEPTQDSFGGGGSVKEDRSETEDKRRKRINCRFQTCHRETHQSCTPYSRQVFEREHCESSLVGVLYGESWDWRHDPCPEQRSYLIRRGNLRCQRCQPPWKGRVTAGPEGGASWGSEPHGELRRSKEWTGK